MAKVNLKEVSGAFVGAPVKETIKFKLGGEEYEADVYVRPLSYKTAVSDIMNLVRKEETFPSRIEACICNEDGTPMFTAADVTGESDPERGPMSPELALALIDAINKVNTAVKMKASPISKRSGTS